MIINQTFYLYLQVKVWFQNRRTKHKREQQENEQQQQQQQHKSSKSASSNGGSNSSNSSASTTSSNSSNNSSTGSSSSGATSGANVPAGLIGNSGGNSGNSGAYGALKRSNSPLSMPGHAGIPHGLGGPPPHAAHLSPHLAGHPSSMAAAAMAHAMRNYPGLTHYEEDDLSDEEIDCDS